MNEDTFTFYDEGWNAYIGQRPYNKHATLDWRDGWLDCEEATRDEGQQKEI